MYVKTWIDKMLKAHPEHDFYEKVLDHILKHRLTTAAGKPRMNPQERSWRLDAAGTRKHLAQSRLEKKWWGPAWEFQEMVEPYIPSRHSPHATGIQAVTGTMPKELPPFRPFGCLAYVHDPRKGDKISYGKGTVWVRV